MPSFGRRRIGYVNLAGGHSSPPREEYSHASYDELESLWKRLSSLGAASRLFAFRDWDLSRLDFSEQDFTGVKFPRGCIFSGAKLGGAVFCRAVLPSASFLGCDLSEADFSQADLSVSDLSGALLSFLDLSGVSLTYAKLAGAKASGCKLIDVDLRYSVCSHTDFSHAIFRKVDFYCSDFAFANLSFACIDECDITGVHLRGAVVVGLEIGTPTPIKRHLAPLCQDCGGPFYAAEFQEGEDGLANEENGDRSVDQRQVQRCSLCDTSISRGDLRIRVIGTDGAEVAKVIQEVRQMQQDSVVINVSGGQIGSLNLGTIVGDIEVHLTSLKNQGGEELADTLRKLTEEVLASKKLNENEKLEATEQIEEITKQADLPDAGRKKGVMRSVISTLGSTLSVIEELKPLWERVVLLLGPYFGLT